ncbi:protocadherin Fat 1-like [Mytilus galloprovincialis]|uniref:protocadherin Fat 1-like n=1 Tax=Mytilus galloprovincialis TaxID=29158 RepID=UPI003F7B8A75
MNSLLRLFLVLLQIYGISGITPCTGNDYVGEHDPKKKKDHTDAETGTVVLLNQDKYIYTCCGFIYQWEFYVSSTGTTEAQVWRHVSGNTYTMVGSNTLTATSADSEKIQTISNGQRIRTNKDDYVGLHSTGNFIITHKDEGGGKNRKKLTGQTSTMTAYQDLDWSAAADKNEKYAIYSYVQQSATPSLSGLGTSTFFNDELSIGDSAGTITTTDSDPEDIGSLTLTILSISNSGSTYFEIVAGSNDITVKAVPPVGTYLVMMEVEDPCTLSSTGGKAITINNRPPEMNNLPGSVSISEDTAGSTLFFTINATDTVTDPLTCTDIGGSTIFSVTAIPSTSDFGVYLNAGITLDYDTTSTHTVTVECSDGDDTDDGTLTINLIRNQPPVIQSLPDTTSLSEDANTNTLLHTLIVTDAESNTITCTLNPTSNIFDVSLIAPANTAYGIYLTGGTPLDYDTTSSYSLTVECSDNRRSDTGTYTVNLIRNTPPVIQNLPDSTSLIEDANTSTLLHTLTVTDAESDTITCTLNPTSAIFDISLIAPANTAYGIYLTGGTTLDYDTTSTYSLTVECSDNRRSDTGTFTVNLIRNTPPEINSLPNTESISEDVSTRTLIHNLNVTDVNAADIITCTLNSNNALFELSKLPPALDEYGVFLKGGTSLNYDSTPSYSLDIECADHRRNVTDVLTVNIIQNEPPTIVNLPMSSEILESITAESLLYTVSVTDPTNDTVTCTLTTATTMFYLQIGSNQYETEIYVRGNQGFVFDTQRQYTLEIVCADQQRNDSSEFYIYILRNMPPYFTNIQDKSTVSAKTTTIGQVIFTVQSIDPENDNLQYTMTTSILTAPFLINQNTGEISLSRSIAAELVSGYELYISVSDGRNVIASRTLSVRITEINSPPEFLTPSHTVTILEGINIGSTIFQPVLTDADVSDVHTFSVSYSPPEGAVYFQVDSSSGIITPLANIDYEIIPFKTFLLVISGSDSLMEDSTNITLNIQNVNEPPTFTKKNYQFTDTENTAGTVLQNPYYQYADEDGDTLTFSFNCGVDTGRLDMDSTTGLLSYAINYDLDEIGTASQINCDVYISDTEYTDTAYLNITVLNDNDNSPKFEHPEYTFFVPITTGVGSVVGMTQATDIDIGSNGDVHYHLTQEGVSNALFEIDDNGSIKLIQSLTSYAEGSVLDFTVYAVDSDGNQDTAAVYIMLPVPYEPTASTQNEIQYMTFFSYAPNMAWFVPLTFVLSITLIVVIHTLYTSKCSCKSSKQNKNKRKRRPRRRLERY